MKEVIAVDLYNQVLTGGVCMTIRAKAGDNDHTPCVIIHNRIVDKTSALITNQNQKVRKDTPSASMGLGGGYIPMIVQEVVNGRTESNSVRSEPY